MGWEPISVLLNNHSGSVETKERVEQSVSPRETEHHIFAILDVPTVSDGLKWMCIYEVVTWRIR